VVGFSRSSFDPARKLIAFQELYQIDSLSRHESRTIFRTAPTVELTTTLKAACEQGPDRCCPLAGFFRGKIEDRFGALRLLEQRPAISDRVLLKAFGDIVRGTDAVLATCVIFFGVWPATST
jgi:hypothetical protein